MITTETLDRIKDLEFKDWVASRVRRGLQECDCETIQWFNADKGVCADDIAIATYILFDAD